MKNSNLQGMSGLLLFACLTLLVLFPTSLVFDIIVVWYDGMNGYFENVFNYRMYCVIDTVLKILLGACSVLAGWMIMHRYQISILVVNLFIILNVLVRFGVLVMPSLLEMPNDIRHVLEMDAVIHLVIAIVTGAALYFYFVLSRRARNTLTF